MKFRIRGFKLKHRVTTLFGFVTRRNRAYQRLDPKPISRILSCLRTKAKSLCFPSAGRTYLQLDERRHQQLMEEKAASAAAPKGKLAVYVGQKDGEFHRFLVPVIYFNHPLFGDLLREAEREFGFDHPGGITIPCRISEFERVQTRIAARCGGRKLLTWKKAA